MELAPPELCQDPFCGQTSKPPWKRTVSHARSSFLGTSGAKHSMRGHVAPDGTAVFTNESYVLTIRNPGPCFPGLASKGIPDAHATKLLTANPG